MVSLGMKKSDELGLVSLAQYTMVEESRALNLPEDDSRLPRLPTFVGPSRISIISTDLPTYSTPCDVGTVRCRCQRTSRYGTPLPPNSHLPLETPGSRPCHKIGMHLPYQPLLSSNARSEKEDLKPPPKSYNP